MIKKIFFIICILFSVNTVNALNITENGGFSMVNDHYSFYDLENNVKVSKGGSDGVNGYKDYLYLLSYDGKSVWCLNPTLSMPRDSSYKEVLKSSNELKTEYEKALYGALAYSYKNYNSFMESHEKNQKLYAAVRLSARAIYYNYHPSGNLNDVCTKLGCLNHTVVAINNLAVRWNKDVRGNDKTELKTEYKYNNQKLIISSSKNGNDYSTEVLKMAKAIYKAGMEYASGASDNKSTENKKVELSTIKSEQKFDGNVIILNNTYKVSVKNGDKKNKLTDFNVAFDYTKTDSSKVKASAICSIDGKTYTKCEDLKNKTVKDNDTIYVKIKIDTSKNDGCDTSKINKLGYSINYSYEGVLKNDLDNVGKLKLIDSATVNTQTIAGFVTADISSGSNKAVSVNGKPVKGEVEVCMVFCKTDIKDAGTCLVEGNVGDSEIKVSEEDQITTTDFIKINRDDYKKYGLYCVIGNTDQRGSKGALYQVGSCKYEDGKSNKMENVVDNNYCTVSCYEEYSDLTYSGAQSVMSGRYLEVGASITGTKTCIVSMKDEYTNTVNNDAAKACGIFTENDDKTKGKGWSTVFGVVPEVEYSYEEKYIKDDSSYKKMSSKTTTLATTTTYCSGLDKNGDCIVLTGNAYDEKGNPNFKYAYQSVKNKFDYSTPEVFYQASSTGIVSVTDDKLDENKYSKINGLPISLDSKAGLYEFTFEITKMGEFYDTCKSGRLIDQDSKADLLDRDKDISANIEYVCAYAINCPECVPGGNIEWPDDPKQCDYCLLDNKLNIYFNTIPTSNRENFNSADREMGYNWNTDKEKNDTVYGGLSTKAEKTVDAIYDGGATIYGESENAILKVELTPSLAKEIREYNKNVNSYSNATLSCSDREFTDKDGNTALAENIFCYSEKLNHWAENFSKNFVFNDDRDNTESYWKTISTNANDIDFDYNYTTYTLGGPSWK